MQCLLRRMCFMSRILVVGRADMVPDNRLMSKKPPENILKINKILYHLGFSKEERKKVLLRNSENTPLTEKKLNRILSTIEKLGFTIQDVRGHPQVLNLRQKIFDHRYKILEEIGYQPDKITLKNISKYPFLCRKTAHQLKDMCHLEEDVDVVKHIFSYTDLPIDRYPSESNEKQSVGELQEFAVKTYLCWKLDMSMTEMDQKYNCYKTLRLRSIRLMIEMYNFLIDDIGLSNEKIKNNIFLLSSSLEEVQEIVNRFPKIGQLPIRAVARAMPGILSRTSDKLAETLQVLKEFKISPRSIRMNLKMLILSAETLRDRLQTLHSDPMFKPYIHHPRLYTFVTNFDRANYRYKILNDARWRCVTVDFLTNSVFKDRLKFRNDISQGKDIAYHLQKELNLEYEKVRSLLSQHPYWLYCSVITVDRTLEYLKEAGFTQSQISSALPVVLYPRREVERYLLSLEAEPEVDCCRDPKSGQLRPEKILQLVLYFLERPYHFTGNGIWVEDDYFETDETSEFLDEQSEEDEENIFG